MIAVLAYAVTHSGFDLYFPNDNDDEHVFMFLLGSCISSLEKYLFKDLAHFKVGCWSFLLLSWKSSSHILDHRLLLDIWFANISSHSVSYLFTLLIISFDAQKFLILMKSTFFLFIVFGIISENLLPNPKSYMSFYVFSMRFMVLVCIFRIYYITDF